MAVQISTTLSKITVKLDVRGQNTAFRTEQERIQWISQERREGDSMTETVLRGAPRYEQSGKTIYTL